MADEVSHSDSLRQGHLHSSIVVQYLQHGHDAALADVLDLGRLDVGQHLGTELHHPVSAVVAVQLEEALVEPALEDAPDSLDWVEDAAGRRQRK